VLGEVVEGGLVCTRAAVRSREGAGGSGSVTCQSPPNRGGLSYAAAWSRIWAIARS